MSFLSIKNLSKAYGKVEVLHDINIEVKKGAFLVLVGPSGCGKSTLLNTIAGLETINSGELIIGGRRVNDLRPSERDIAMVFQSYALYPTMTVGQNMAFGMKMRKVPKDKRDLEVARVAKILKIEGLLDRKPGQLSGGQRQRVAMGRALVRNPQVFLFDEPLSNLDAKLRVEVRSEIKQLHNNLKPTIVYVTHDQIEAMTLATEIAILKDGILQQVGTPHQVYTRPANLFVADFMGSPPMNLVKAKIKGKKVVVDHQSGGGKDDPLLLDVAGVKSEYEGKDVIVGIRPEAITDPGVATARVKKSMTAKCKIDFVEHSGADNFVFTKLGGTEVCARMSADYKVSIGGYADFVFHLDSAVLFDPKTERLIS